MALNLQPITRKFYNIIGDKETVTYFTRLGNNEGFDGGQTVQNVKRRYVEKDLMDNDFSSINMHFHLWADILNPLEILPKRGDKITDSSDIDWIVDVVEVQSIENRYRCYCYMDRGQVFEGVTLP